MLPRPSGALPRAQNAPLHCSDKVVAAISLRNVTAHQPDTSVIGYPHQWPSWTAHNVTPGVGLHWLHGDSRIPVPHAAGTSPNGHRADWVTTPQGSTAMPGPRWTVPGASHHPATTPLPPRHPLRYRQPMTNAKKHPNNNHHHAGSCRRQARLASPRHSTFRFISAMRHISYKIESPLPLAAATLERPKKQSRNHGSRRQHRDALRRPPEQHPGRTVEASSELPPTGRTGLEPCTKICES